MATGDDDVEIELVDSSIGSDDEGADGRRHRRRRRGTARAAGRRPRRLGLLAVAVVAAAGTAVGLIAIFGGSDEGGEDRDVAGDLAVPPTAPTSSEVDASDGTELDATDHAALAPTTLDEPRPFFDEPLRTRLLWADAGDTWHHVDPDEGWMIEVPELQGVDAGAIIPLEDAVAVLERSGAPVEIVRLPTPRRPPDPARTLIPSIHPDELSRVMGIVPTGTPDRFWLLVVDERTRGELSATLAGLDGTAMAGPVQLPGMPTAGTADGVVVEAGGRAFLVGPDVRRDLGGGDVIAAAGHHAAIVRCDERTRCRQDLVDVTTGAVVADGPLPTDAVAAGRLSAVAAPNGSVATLLAHPRAFRRTAGQAAAGAPTSDLHVTTTDGRHLQTTVDNPRTAPVWSPDGRHVLVLTGLGLFRYTVTDDGLVAERSRVGGPGDVAAVVAVPSLP